MSGFVAVFKKEIANYFVSPIAYSVIAMFLLISGFFFWANLSVMSLISLQAANDPMISQRINLTDVVIRPLTQNMSIVLLFLTPLLTMRLFSEEKKTGAIELLLTYPISDLSVVMGKYCAAILVLLAMLLGTLSYPIMLWRFGGIDTGVFLTGYLGLIMMGAAFVGLGIFVSLMTENQIIAAALSFGLALMFWIISWTSSFVGQTAGAVLKQLSILERLESFHKGVISLADVSFFILFSAFFIFLSLRSLESLRWRG
ncbi:MAG: ABC transporter permease subunit [Syntrophaceae bacterium]|nr:ABC transporter permease subunit [Syntrophaceae bacterium]